MEAIVVIGQLTARQNTVNMEDPLCIVLLLPTSQGGYECNVSYNDSSSVNLEVAARDNYQPTTRTIKFNAGRRPSGGQRVRGIAKTSCM